MSRRGTRFQVHGQRLALLRLSPLRATSRRSWRMVVVFLTLTFSFAAGPLFAQGIPTSAGRKLAPDALRVISPSIEFDETYQGPVELPFVGEHPELQWSPNYMATNETLLELGKEVVFRGRVHALEFAFKPVRMIDVDVATTAGVQRKLVWYMIYRVRYLGGELQPKAEPDQFNNEVYGLPEAVSNPWVRFIPAFRLEAKGLDEEYLDTMLPSAVAAIAARERVALSNNRNELAKLHDSVEMQQLKIERSTDVGDKPVWGVAMWVDVDPRVDFFAVQVSGLTNAQQIELTGDELVTRQKTLVLHFSRAGDTVNELQDRIRYGIPALSDPQRQQYVLDQFGVPERLDHMWVYR